MACSRLQLFASRVGVLRGAVVTAAAVTAAAAAAAGISAVVGAAALGAVLGLTGIAALPSSAHAFCQTTTQTQLTGSDCITAGTPLRWERQCITFSVQSDDPAVRNAVDRSFESWGAIDCGGRPLGLALRQTEETARCTIAEYNSDAPNMNAILFVDDWEQHAELPLDAFAVTLVWNLKDTGEIVDADMLLNPTLGNLTICDNQCADQDNDIDIQNVVTHEAGHFLGLAHTDVDGATMSPTAPVGQTEKRDLADDDVAGLCAIYSDFGPASCRGDAFVPRHGFSPDCRQPPSSNGGCSVQAAGAQGGAASDAWLALSALAAAWLAHARRRRR